MKDSVKHQDNAKEAEIEALKVKFHYRLSKPNLERESYKPFEKGLLSMIKQHGSEQLKKACLKFFDKYDERDWNHRCNIVDPSHEQQILHSPSKVKDWHLNIDKTGNKSYVKYQEREGRLGRSGFSFEIFDQGFFEYAVFRHGKKNGMCKQICHNGTLYYGNCHKDVKIGTWIKQKLHQEEHHASTF